MKTPDDSFHFELASIDNLDYLLEKTLQLHLHEFDNSNSAFALVDDFSKQLKDWLSDELNSKNVLIFVLKLNDVNVGYAHLKVIPTNNSFFQAHQHGYIQAIWIDQEHRKKGLAKQVIHFIESIFNEQNLPYYELSYTTKNSIAATFWDSLEVKPFAVQCRKSLD